MGDKHVILFLAANPGGIDRLGLDREAHAIRVELERAGHRDQFELHTLLAAEPLDLLRGLRKLHPTVVHYCGRGEDRGLSFQAGDGSAAIVTADALTETFGAAGGSVKLVVLSACHSDDHARALLAHVECVVGMAGSIHHDAARSFAAGFYGGLGDGESVAAAFRQGCAAIRLEHDRVTDPATDAGASERDARRPQLVLRPGGDAEQIVLAPPAVPALPAEPDTRSAPATAVPVFVIYAAEDRVHHVTLETLLAPFERAGSLVVVGRREVDGALPFDDPPHPRAPDARLVVLLVSKHLLYADYFSRAPEIKQVCDRYAHGRATIVPVRLGSAAMSATWLAGHPAIPDGEPILERADVGASLLATAVRIGEIAAALATGTGGDAVPQRQFRREAYLSSLLRRLEAADVEGHDAFVEPRKEIVDPDYDRAFELPPTGASDGMSVAGTAHRPRSTTVSLTRLLDQVNTARVTALLGEPGSGKSLLLLELACALADRAARDRDAPIPVHVKLGSFTAPLDNETAFARFLVDNVAAGPPDELSLAPELLRLIERGRVILLCDGLDELPRGDFRARVFQASEFARTHERCRVIFACRSNDCPPELDLQRIVIAPFGSAQIATFLRRALGKPRSEAQALTAQLTRPESPLHALATRPFFLSVIARYIERHDRLPHETREVIQDLLQQPRMLRALAAYGPTERLAIDRGLDELAVAMLDLGGVGTSLPPAGVLTRLAEVQGRDSAAALVDLGVGTGLLERDREGAVRFFHPLVQEFLVSRAIAALPDAAREAWLIRHVDDPWLREIYVFIAQQGVSLDALVAAICAGATEQLARPAVTDPAERIAREWELLPHELRLVLVGRLIEAGARIDAARCRVFGDLLSSLAAGAGERLGPGAVVARVLRASRGPALAEPRLRSLIQDQLRRPRSEHCCDALVARASHAITEGTRRQLSREVSGHAVHTNYPLRFSAYRSAVARDARCLFLQPAVTLALVLHAALSLAGLALLITASHGLRWESALPVPALLTSAGIVVAAHLLSFTARSPRSPAVAVLRAELAGAIVAVLMFGTALAADAVIDWLGPRAIAVPHGHGDRAELASILDAVRWCALGTTAVMIFSEATAREGTPVRWGGWLAGVIAWGCVLGGALVAGRGYLEGTLPGWMRAHLLIALLAVFVIAVLRQLRRRIAAGNVAARLRTAIAAAITEIALRLGPDRGTRRSVLAILVVGGGLFAVVELAMAVLIPAGGMPGITGVVIMVAIGIPTTVFMFAGLIELFHFVVVPNYRSLSAMRRPASIEDAIGYLELLASPFVLPELRRVLARRIAKMNPPSAVVAVLFQSRLLDEFATMDEFNNDAFMLTELRRGLARRMAKPSRLRAVVAGLLQSPLLDKLAATQGARNKKPRPQNSWKRDQTLEASVDALQNRLARGDTAGLDDELRLLEAIRTTHSEPQWKTVCRAWARLAGGHRDALSRRAAVHRSAAEVLAQLPSDGEERAAP